MLCFPKKRILYYPAIRSIGQDTKSTVSFFHSFCTVRDFPARALPIGVNFAWQFGLISDRFSRILGRMAPGMAELWASSGAIWQDMVFIEALVYALASSKSE